MRQQNTIFITLEKSRDTNNGKKDFRITTRKTGGSKNKNYEEFPELRFEMSLESMPRNLDFLKWPKTMKKALSPIEA